ncbi:MAG: glycosyltransferase [Candidatus Roizmanbacteria bacterium]|nr:glycosyltransferase [Candidatus Roizmanbacteria bacterium]
MGEKPVISIIIPAYNEEKYVNECLSSVFNQKCNSPFEVIVVDNNSHDKTSEIASVWKEVKLIKELRPGATVTRNTGAKASQSEILYFLDADCRLFPNALQKIINAFEDDHACQLLSGPYIYDRDGFFPKLATDTLHYFSLFHLIVKLCFGVSQFPGGNFAIRKELFNKVGGFDETICNQEIILPDDLDLAIRIQKHLIKDLIFSREFAVYSSFRRVKRSPIKDTLVRFFATLDMLSKRK